MLPLAPAAWRWPLRSRRGVAALEFALVVPVLILLLLATVDYGRAISQNIRLSNAVRAGAQYALSFPDDVAGINARVTAALGGWTDVSVATECQCAGGSASASACTQICTGIRVTTVRASRPFSAYHFTNITSVRSNVTLRVQ
jgi:Flp pilus assembly protein TadG